MNKYDRQHQRFGRTVANQIDKLYSELLREAALLGGTGTVKLGETLFSFDDYPALKNRVQKLLSAYHDGVYGVIVNGINTEWTLSNNKNSELSRQVFGRNIGRLTQAQYRRYFSTNDSARQAFIARKEAGLNLSERVWRYTDMFKREIELGLDVGIRSGMPAAEMASELKAWLREPDRLYSRVRDTQDGSLHLSKPAQEYHSGQGVYRSSYKNARRLAVTETNMAYRTSDFLRWQQLDFVVGIEIKLSNNHPQPDICDDLAGRYPKDFKFVGWHPHCRCHVEAILKSEEEMDADTDRILNGEKPSEQSVNTVESVPQEFENWVNENEDRLMRSQSVPYFLSDNPQYTGVRQNWAGGGYNGTKFGRSATKAALKEYDNTGSTVISEVQKENIDRIAKDLGVKAAPMTFIDADDGRGNIHYKNDTLYSENCQSCVAVHEARLRGLNITARAYSPEQNSVQFRLGERFQDIWQNPKTGKIPEPTLVKGSTSENMIAKLESGMKSTGRYHIGINLTNGTGHVITAERLPNKKLIYYDAQNGDFLNIREIAENVESYELLKVDKLIFNSEMLKAVSEVIK